MASEKVNNYINKAYKGWLDYSAFQCQRARLNDQSGDVLNEVIIALLTKNGDFLDDLLNQDYGKTTGLDAFVLRMIYRFAHLPRATYRWNYCRHHVDQYADIDTIEYCEEETEPDEWLNEADNIQVIELIEQSDISQLAKDVFLWKFQERNMLINWPGKETKKEVYAIYDKVLTYLLHRFEKPDRTERKSGVRQLTLF